MELRRGEKKKSLSNVVNGGLLSGSDKTERQQTEKSQPKKKRAFSFSPDAGENFAIQHIGRIWCIRKQRHIPFTSA